MILTSKRTDTKVKSKAAQTKGRQEESPEAEYQRFPDHDQNQRPKPISVPRGQAVSPSLALPGPKDCWKG